MSSFADLKRKVLRLLNDTIQEGDTVSGKAHSAALLKDGIHAALDAILPWISKRATLSLEDGESAYALPDDFYQIEAVLDDGTGQFLSPSIPTPGNYWGEGNMSGNTWMEYPRGYLTFSMELSSGGTLYYRCTWLRPENEADALDIPSFLETAVALFTASYCILPEATQAGALGQYKTKIDSGSPTDNPVADMSSYFLRRFEIEMARIPMQLKGGVS